MEFLLKSQNTYRVSSEMEALQLRERLRDESNGNLTQFSYVIKEIKQKGEVIDSYYLCKATIDFTLEKEPDRRVKAVYEDA